MSDIAVKFRAFIVSTVTLVQSIWPNTCTIREFATSNRFSGNLVKGPNQSRWSWWKILFLKEFHPFRRCWPYTFIYFSCILTRIVFHNQNLILNSIIFGRIHTYTFTIVAKYFRKRILYVDASSGIMISNSLSPVAQNYINWRLRLSLPFSIC